MYKFRRMIEHSIMLLLSFLSGNREIHIFFVFEYDRSNTIIEKIFIYDFHTWYRMDRINLWLFSIRL